jgi:tetratricopeptide (TPR) repeat protein
MEESEIIDKYLRGELDTEQLEIFLKKLQSDVTLQKKIALRKLIVAGISQSYAEELKFKLAEFDHLLEGKKRFQLSWKMAAAVAILLISGSIFYLAIQKSNPYDFDIVEPGLPNAMGANNTIKLNNAMSTFKAEDYQAAGKAFEKLLTDNPKSDTVLYFAGLCDFRNKKNQLAIQKWIQIEASSIFFAKTEYRLAIAYWSIGDEKKAVELLEKIGKEKNNPLRKESVKALDALD